jgi:hypothetical protein
MATILEQVMPEGVSLDMLDEVTDEMGVDGNPPDGMLVHIHFEQDGRVRVVDVWDSREAYEAFLDARLMPAMQAVLRRNGVEEAPPQPETSMAEIHRVVQGR